MTTHALIRKARARISWLDQRGLPLPVCTAIVTFCLFGIVGAIGRLGSTAAQVAAQPTPSLPVYIVQTATPLPLPTAEPIQVAAVQPNTLRQAVVAYDAPAGNAIGAIEQGRAYTVLARYGADWLQADVTDSGLVWLKADQVLDLPADLTDLQPTDAPQIIYVAAQPAPAYAAPTMEPLYQVTSDPPAPAYEPARAPQAAPAATAAPAVRAEEFTAQDPQRRCLFIGCLP